ncbi:MAG: adenylosuccinate lyase, partial [Bdellovibrionales bacterium]|nr:adenylosuccinate lyase [Bdellovibrionales bacterium]
MISRYTRSEMGDVWSQENRFSHLLDVEIAVARVQAQLGIIPKKAADEIRKKSKFDVDRINEIEKTTKHDIIAFVSCVAENVGEWGRYIHYGMTSSDALDTALSLQIQEAYSVLSDSFKALDVALLDLAQKTSSALCSGRTHGMHAEPTTFGYKMLGFYSEFLRAQERVKSAIDQISICKLSGAVGTYSSQSEEVERKVAGELGLSTEWFATQVIPRDRHAEVLVSLSLLGGFLERLAVELRHLQRTEMSEAIEGFSKGQKGSSAMPHKKNPISAENITGLARLLRSYGSVSLENIALWHERDISHSSVERVIFPDAFILADYACNRMAGVLNGLHVNTKQLRKNMEISQGQMFSSLVLLEIVKAGLTREEAYSMV